MSTLTINIEDIENGLCASEEAINKILTDGVGTPKELPEPLTIVDGKIVASRTYSTMRDLSLLIPYNTIYCDFSLMSGYSIQDYLEASINYLLFSNDETIQNIFIDMYKYAIELIDNDFNLITIPVVLGNIVLNKLTEKYNINYNFKNSLVSHISGIVYMGRSCYFKTTTERNHITFEKFIEFFVCR